MITEPTNCRAAATQFEEASLENLLDKWYVFWYGEKVQWVVYHNAYR